MDEGAQVQAIMDRLRGVSTERLPDPAAFAEPWRTIYGRVRCCGGREEAVWLIGRAAAGLDGGRQLAKWLVRQLPPDEDFYGYASLEEMAGRFPDVDWLWPRWIPRGMLTVFGAEPGAGKSMVALDLARRVIHGEPFPDGAPNAFPRRNVLLVDAEGAPALLRQRAEAWGIDSERLFLMLAPTGGGPLDLAHRVPQRRLLRMCAKLDPALVVIDSLAAATAGSENSLEGVRAILGFLSAMARKGGTAMVVVHHLRKRARSVRSATRGRVAADDLRGSSHISAAARSVMALSVLKESRGRRMPAALREETGAQGEGPTGQEEGPGGVLHVPRRLEIVKTNLCRPPQPLLLRLEGEEAGVPTLRYSEWVEPTPEPGEVDLCASWLVEYLGAAAEAVRPAEVVRAAAEEGFSRSMVYRARSALGELVEDVGKGVRDPRKRWRLGEE